MPKRLIKVSRTQPARAILGIVAILTFLAGLWLFSPWHIPTSLGGPAVSTAFETSRMIGAGVNILATVPALIALRKNTPEWIARGAFWLFCWYTFVMLTRLILAWGTLSFVPILIIALIMGVVYVEQTWIYKGKSVAKEVVSE